MHEDPQMVEEFMAEVNDKYYPRVMEGLEFMGSGQMNRGIETVARPLHTIKGVTGFMGGFEQASAFTHDVESYLKKMAAGDIPENSDTVALAMESVNEIFEALERIRATGSIRGGDAEDISARLGATMDGGGHAKGDSTSGEVIMTETRDGYVVTPAMRRIHLSAQRKALTDKLAVIPQGSSVTVDLSGVTSMGSKGFEEAGAFAGQLTIRFGNMSPACKEIFYAWGFDKILDVCGDETDGGPLEPSTEAIE